MLRLSWLRIIVVALTVAAVSAAVFAFVLPLRGAGRAYYDLPSGVVILAFVAAFMAVIGGQLILWRYRGSVGLLSALATALIVLGVLAILSIGLLFLIVGLLVLVALSRVLRGYEPISAAVSVSSGAALGLGLLTLALVVVQPPVVECLPGDGARVSSQYWWGAGAQSGSGNTSSGGGTTSGTMQAGRRTIHFVCRDGQLVEFRQDQP